MLRWLLEFDAWSVAAHGGKRLVTGITLDIAH